MLTHGQHRACGLVSPDEYIDRSVRDETDGADASVGSPGSASLTKTAQGASKAYGAGGGC